MSLSKSQQRRGNQPGNKRSGMKLDCSLGHVCYATKAEALKANAGARVTRCGRCRHWRTS